MPTICPCVWTGHDISTEMAAYEEAFPEFSVARESGMMTQVSMGTNKLHFLKGGPTFRPNQSISFFVVMEHTSEVDQAFARLSKEGKVMMPLDTYPWSERYAWIEDTLGVHWQLFHGDKTTMQGSLVPCLMFSGDNAGKAEDAISFYRSVFEDALLLDLNRYEEGEEKSTEWIKHGRFRLLNQAMAAMDSSRGPGTDFNEGISFILTCDTQEEIDYFWEKLTDGGEAQMCGWLKDRFGVSWQVVPSILPALMSNPETAKRVTDVFLMMQKFDIARLQSA